MNVVKMIGAVALVLSMSACGGNTKAESNDDYFGKSAEQVASAIKCADFESTATAEDVLHEDSGVCHLNGKRVNVIVFESKEQQNAWNEATGGMLGDAFYWANGNGAVVVAKDGNEDAANEGADALPGKVVHG